MSFSEGLAKWCRKTKPEQLTRTVRIVMIEIGKRIVLRSPVGNPDLWLSLVGGEYVDYLSVHGDAGGYVGGHFRRNWQYGFDSVPEGEIKGTDKSGRDTISALTSAINASNVIGINYIANNLPYARRLEDGWSTQAPSGMVALTELEFPQIVKRAYSA